MVLPTTGSRTQIVWIISQTQRLQNMEIREIWAPAFKWTGPVTGEMANRMLKMNDEMKIGAWRAIPAGNNTYLIVYAAQIAAESSAETYQTVMRAVMMTADKYEEEITGKDDW